MPALEKVGVQLEAKDWQKFVNALNFAGRAITQLNKTFAKFTQDIAQESQKAEKSTNDFANALTGIAKKGQMLPGVLGKASGAAAGLGKALAAGGVGAAALATGIGVALVAALAAAIKITGKIISTIKELGIAFAKTAISIIEQAAMLGGRFTEMELAAVAVGRGVGIADAVILKAIKSVNAMNIRYDVAAASVLRMARVQIDLKYATDLVRVAQAIAIETGRESSEEMTSLTHALTTNNVQMLRRHGIIIDNEAAERRFAEANNLAVDSLTQRQKIEAQVQAVIRESAHLMGVYEAAMQSGAKLMRSIESRLIPEFLAALGAPMQGAFSAVTKAVYDFLTALNASITEGGRFYPTMVKIGAVVQIVAEHIADFVKSITQFFTTPVFTTLGGRVLEGVQVFDKAANEMNQAMSDLAVAAFEWGAEIMAQFAQGLAAGLRFVGEAMLLIADTLAYWLASFSPPRVAPDIAKWGVAAMAEYLRGFTMVDFGAFEGIQKVLGRLLSGPKLAGLLGEIIEAMATGTVGEGLFARISAATGAYGAEIVKLTKLQFKYAEALRAVTAAQLALTRAQEAVKGHSLEVDKLVREYNKLLRAGAGDEILDTRLAEINMSERARNAAIVERDEAQVAIRLAEERLGPIKEALALQEKLVDVLLDLAAAQADVVEETKKAAKGAAEEILEEFGAVGAGIGGAITTGMQKAIDAIKGSIAARLKDIFRPVWEAWFGKPEKVTVPWDIGGGEFTPIPGAGPPTLPTGAMTGGVVQAFDGVVTAFDKLREIFGDVDWDGIKAAFDTAGKMWLEMNGPLQLLIKALNLPTWDEFIKGIEDFTSVLMWMRDNKDWLFPALTGDVGAVSVALGERAREGIAQLPAAPWEGAGVTAGGRSFTSGLYKGMHEGIDSQEADKYSFSFIEHIKRAFGIVNPATKMYPIGTSISEGIATGMPMGMPFIFTSMQAIAEEMLAAVGPDVTSPLADTIVSVGRAFTVLIAKGIKDNVGIIINALDEAMERAQVLIQQAAHQGTGGGGDPRFGASQQQGGYSPRGGTHHPGEYVIPAGLTRALMQPVSHTSNVQIGPNNISQAIDEAYLMSRIRNQIRREMSRA